ncbi:hypothetical protein RCL1_006332 [Eukaryota sp. TZLM3-RCL]
MVLITEYRLCLPLSTEEYHIGQLYTCAIAARNESDGQDGLEIIANEPYEDERSKGQYTHKILHLAKHIPRFIRPIIPKSAMLLEEKAWNAYPYCRTVYSNGYLGDRFYLEVETMHLDDRGDTPNALTVGEEELKSRTVDVIDIVNDELSGKDYKPEHDLREWDSSLHPGRGRLGKDWITTHSPVMTAYKTIRVKFNWLGLSTRVERYIMKVIRDVFNKYHRQTVCTMDNWIDFTMDDIRKLEDETKELLDDTFKKARESGESPSSEDTAALESQE